MNAVSYGLTLDQFWGMSVWEWLVYVDGVERREEFKQTLVAQHAAWLMNMWKSKGATITVDKLITRKFAGGQQGGPALSDKVRSMEDFEKYFEDKQEKKDIEEFFGRGKE